MSTHTRRLVLVVPLLALAALVVWLPQLTDRSSSPTGNVPAAGRQLSAAESAFYMYVADTNGWVRTEDQSVIASQFDLSPQGEMADFPSRLGNWQGEDVNSNGADLLGFDPQQQVFRAYKDGQGGFLWLRMLATDKWKLFYHAPPICYSNNGWQRGPETTHSIKVGQATLNMKSFVAHQGQFSHLVLYTFLWPNKYRDMQAGVTMFELAAPVNGNKDVVLRQLEEFTRLILTDSPAVPEVDSFAMQHRVDANLANEITLLGYDLSSTEIRPGEKLAVTLYWQAQSSIDEDYTVFVHVLKRPEEESSDRVMAQQDRQPFDGLFPTSRWQVGQVVKEVYELSIPEGVAPGERQVEVGMYLLATRDRLNVVDAAGSPLGDRVLLPSVHISTPATP